MKICVCLFAYVRKLEAVKVGTETFVVTLNDISEVRCVTVAVLCVFRGYTILLVCVCACAYLVVVARVS